MPGVNVMPGDECSVCGLMLCLGLNVMSGVNAMSGVNDMSEDERYAWG